ncbi:hypothetical protein ACN28E_24885 [Archangium lansingense]|uniref:hypothetical protein n=1 Tax=Archangium lansingense TaxID=2995310 RepID=UPI003B771B75
MTPEELADWRRQRALHLCSTEPELRVSDIAERLGVEPGRVSTYLREAGVPVRKEGRDSLPAGPPVR